jgi:hypothetical protein
MSRRNPATGFSENLLDRFDRQAVDVGNLGKRSFRTSPTCEAAPVSSYGMSRAFGGSGIRAGPAALPGLLAGGFAYHPLVRPVRRHSPAARRRRRGSWRAGYSPPATPPTRRTPSSVTRRRRSPPREAVWSGATRALPERQAERIRRDLRHRRFEALSDRSRADTDRHRAVRLEVEPRRLLRATLLADVMRAGAAEPASASDHSTPDPEHD